MKYLVVIWSLLITCLAVVPCADAAADCGEEIHLHDTSSQDHHQSDGQDICSPFCFCHCCHTHTVTADTPEEFFVIPTAKNRHNLTITHSGQDFYSVWHPPKG